MVPNRNHGATAAIRDRNKPDEAPQGPCAETAFGLAGILTNMEKISLPDVNGGIRFDILLAIPAVIGDGASGEVDVAADDPARHEAARNSGNVLLPA